MVRAHATPLHGSGQELSRVIEAVDKVEEEYVNAV